MGDHPAEESGREGAPPAGPAAGRRPAARYSVAIVVVLLAAAALFLTIGPSHAPRIHVIAQTHVSGSTAPASGPLPACGAECDPIDPRYLTDLRFGRTSFWIQPWRAYLDTWPGERLPAALGINFNVKPGQALATARALHDFGFRLARMEIEWSALSFQQPDRFVHEASIRARLLALHAYGLRPLIVLNANSEAPCPSQKVTLETTVAAAAGSRTVVLSAASAAAVRAGRTGFDRGAFFAPLKKRKHPASQRPRLSRQQRAARRAARHALRRTHAAEGINRLVLRGAPGILITSVGTGGVATLSRAIPRALPAGPHPGTTLLYAPFSAPKLPDGSPNPAFQATLNGWLSYVGAVTGLARSIFGPGGFDIEVWNELTFGSEFLNVAHYSDAGGSAKADTKAVTRAILDATVAYVRNPASGLSPHVGITDGFASETPFPSGALSPVGLTALSKHPYAGARVFPAEYKVRASRPINALGTRDTSSPRSFTPAFIPSYQTLLPEYTLQATSTETLIRDLAPFTTTVYRFPHGRDVGPAGGTPVQKWITEYNLEASATPVGPDESTPLASVNLTSAETEHFRAKALLRSLVAMVSKGVSRVYFFAAAPGALSLISRGFWAALAAHPGSYPGDGAVGATLLAFRNLLGRFRGPGPSGTPRQLKLISIHQLGDHSQFQGDGTAAHPALYDREVLAVFPYQTSPTRFVIPIYVMSRDLLTLYRPGAPAGDLTRWDLPQESFRITLGNLPASAAPPAVSAYDPLLNTSSPARLIGASSGRAELEVAASDYPRLLTLQYP